MPDPVILTTHKHICTIFKQSVRKRQMIQESWWWRTNRPYGDEFYMAMLWIFPFPKQGQIKKLPICSYVWHFSYYILLNEVQVIKIKVFCQLHCQWCFHLDSIYNRNITIIHATLPSSFCSASWDGGSSAMGLLSVIVCSDDTLDAKLGDWQDDGGTDVAI